MTKINNKHTVQAIYANEFVLLPLETRRLFDRCYRNSKMRNFLHNIKWMLSVLSKVIQSIHLKVNTYSRSMQYEIVPGMP